MNSTNTKGYLFALGAALALSASFIFSKSVLNQLQMLQFGATWFTVGLFWNLGWFFFSKEHKQLKAGTRKQHLVAFTVAILEGTATGLFYMAIRAMENPAVVSFIGNIGPVFVTLMGVILLGERFKGAQLAGILVTITGIFVINYRGGSFAGFGDPGSIYVICASFLFSLATIVGRRWHKHMLTAYMSLLRSFLLALVFGILLFLSGDMPQMSFTLWRDIALGSLLETLLVIILAYRALKMIEATKTSLIISTKGVWTLMLAWIFLGVFPSGLQVLGGIMTLVGVWLITWQGRVSRR